MCLREREGERLLCVYERDVIMCVLRYKCGLASKFPFGVVQVVFQASHFTGVHLWIYVCCICFITCGSLDFITATRVFLKSTWTHSFLNKHFIKINCMLNSKKTVKKIGTDEVYSIFIFIYHEKIG